LEGLGIENVVIFYDHLEYFTAIWYHLQPFGIVCGHLVYFFPFWYVWTKKNLATLIFKVIVSLCYQLNGQFYGSGPNPPLPPNQGSTKVFCTKKAMLPRA
jgi:hypothetical protein